MPNVEKSTILPIVNSMTERERLEAKIRVSINSPEKLKEFLEASGRLWLVFNARHLVESLPWPEGVNSFMQIIDCYRDHRRVIPTGDLDAQTQLPITHGETLTIEELDRCIRYLIEQASKLDPNWKLV